MILKPFSKHETERPLGMMRIMPMGQAPIYDTPVTPRENYKLALSGKQPYWTPMFTDCKMFMPNISPDNVCRAFVVGNEMFMFPRDYAGGLDMFGIKWTYEPDVGGSTVMPGHPFIEDAAEIMEKTVWPDITKWDWEGCAQRNASYLDTNLAIDSMIFCGFFERLISFMDFENAAVALIDEDSQEYVHAFFDKLTGLYEEMIPRLKKYFHIDNIEFHDDWGSQRAPLFGIDTVREMILPYLKRVVKCAHDNDIIFEMHSCGSHAEHTPAMIEAGVDYWAPQPDCNDTMAIFEKYGDKITIGVGCPLPLGSSDEKYIAWAHEFVEKCVGREGKRTPFLNNMRCPEALRRTVYELSRKKLCGWNEN